MYHLQPKLVKVTNKSHLLRSSCNPSQGTRWRVCDCPVRFHCLCSFSSASFVWTFSCGWSPEGLHLLLPFLFSGRDSWSSFGSQQELSILHSLSLLCPFFLSPFHDCRVSVQENYLALMFKHLSKGQTEPSGHTLFKTENSFALCFTDLSPERTKLISPYSPTSHCSGSLHCHL